jgi:tRNA-splicing ligase RtcB (3'-phosphate/5'-hydroxy nucleic acid ligase)
VDIEALVRISDTEWQVPRTGKMRVPAILYADEKLVRDMDDKVREQMVNVAMLPGIVKASYAMPDAHWGYGFPIGGVAAFDPDDGIISAGGVGFDISCGVRTLLTGLRVGDLTPLESSLAEALFETVPAGVGSRGAIVLDTDEMDAMLTGGAAWAVARGYGVRADLERIEENGCMAGARPEYVSGQAKHRQRREMGTLGSGNHYLEMQVVTQLFAAELAAAYELQIGDVLVTIHCGSRGLGHQIGTEYLREMAIAAAGFGIDLPDRELACAPIRSELGQRYLGAMNAGINCALANRQIVTHLVRQVFERFFPDKPLRLLFDVSHNTCKLESHLVDGQRRELYVHRKGATRAFAPRHPSLPPALREAGQPVLIGGSMGTASYVLAGTVESEQHAFSSACHGAGRAMSRRAAGRQWRGRAVVDELAGRGIIIKSPSSRGVAEEAPGAYKDVKAVVEAAQHANLARIVARLEPVICIKG